MSDAFRRKLKLPGDDMEVDNAALIADFGALSAQLDQEASLKESLRERARALETHARAGSSALNAVHGAKESQIADVVAKAEATLPATQEAIAQISELLPEWTFHKYHDLFARSLQNAVFNVVLTGWLKEDRLLSKAEVTSALKIDTFGDAHFQLPTEDYLHGLISLNSELARLCINAVTNGNYAYPLKISSFCKELSSGFALLNLKNDSLRRRFDSMKYDLRRIEETLFDITLRGLIPKETLDHIEGPKTKRPREE